MITDSFNRIAAVSYTHLFYVIQLADVPSDWKSISLRIKVDDPSKTDILKCYANTESVQTVPELHAKTKNEYLRDKMCIRDRFRRDS